MIYYTHICFFYGSHSQPPVLLGDGIVDQAHLYKYTEYEADAGAHPHVDRLDVGDAGSALGHRGGHYDHGEQHPDPDAQPGGDGARVKPERDPGEDDERHGRHEGLQQVEGEGARKFEVHDNAAVFTCGKNKAFNCVCQQILIFS